MTNTFSTLDDFNYHGKRVLVRSDLNVPMRNGKVTDYTRLERTAKTIKELSNQGARIIILSHFGRPKGKRIPEMSLAPVASALEAVLKSKVAFADDCVGSTAEKAISKLKNGEVILLENLRYHEQEEANDKNFAKRIASLGNFYINDAFSCAHRAHASTEALAKLLPAAAGRCMQTELSALEKALSSPERPVGAVVGGAKVSTKIDLLSNLISKVDILVIGGGMANTFLLAKGTNVGKSLCEPDLTKTAINIDTTASLANCEIVLPQDVVVANEFKAGADSNTVNVDSVPSDAMILDLGPASVNLIESRLSICKTIVWNGPLGAFEIPPFDNATNSVAKMVGKLCSDGKLLAVAGGGDTVSALTNANAADSFSYLSTAGGAFLEWMEGKELPGVAVLSN